MLFIHKDQPRRIQILMERNQSSLKQKILFEMQRQEFRIFSRGQRMIDYVTHTGALLKKASLETKLTSAYKNSETMSAP